MTSDSSENKTFLQVGSTDCYEDQSGKQKTTTDLHRGFILVGKMTNSMLQLADGLEEEGN